MAWLFGVWCHGRADGVMSKVPGWDRGPMTPDGRRALFSDRLFTLPGIGADLPVVLSYNSSVWSTSTPSAVTGTAGSGWVITGFDQRLVAKGDGSVTYFGPGGLSGVFTPDGSGGFVAPPQFQAILTGSATSGYVLVVHVSQQHLAFTGGGRLTSVTDRNGNVTSFGYSPYGYPSSITSTRGPVAARTVSVTVSSGRITGLTQTSGGHTRSALPVSESSRQLVDPRAAVSPANVR